MGHELTLFLAVGFTVVALVPRDVRHGDAGDVADEGGRLALLQRHPVRRRLRYYHRRNCCQDKERK